MYCTYVVATTAAHSVFLKLSNIFRVRQASYLINPACSNLFVFPFRYLQWADYLHTVQVKSIRYSRQLVRQRGVANEYTSSRLLVIAAFKVHPLELVACLSVDRKVGFISVSCLPDNTLVLLYSLWPLAREQLFLLSVELEGQYSSSCTDTHYCKF